MAHRKTLAELRTAVRDNLDESATGFWTDATLNRMVNRSKDRVWLEVRKLKDDFFAVTRTSLDGVLTIVGDSYDTASFRLVAGTRDYTLPPDLAELKTIEAVTSTYEWVRFTASDTARAAMRAAMEVTEQVDPHGFLFDIIGERTLRLAPKSNRSLDLRLTYIAVVPDLTAETDTLEMPHPLYKAVEEYATASALKMDRDQNAAAWESSGNATITTFIGAHSRQNQDPEYVEPYL